MISSEAAYQTRLATRHRFGRVFEWICRLSTWFGMFVLAWAAHRGRDGG